jgi:hypothetical protein
MPTFPRTDSVVFLRQVPLHLKESEWRWNNRRDNFYSLLLKETRSHPLN